MTGRAVVIGAGIGGMLAAAALAPAVGDVVVVEPDALADGPHQRKGLPQGQHAHLLMAGGLDAMRSLLPGLDVRRYLLDAGAVEVSLASGLLARTPDGWFSRFRHDSHHLLTCTRALLDWAVRAAVLSRLSNVKIVQGKALGLVGTAQRVQGVRVATDAGEDLLRADLVVDAGGRGSRIVHWLADLGIDGIQEKVVDTGLTNATRIYRRPAVVTDWPLTLLQADPYRGEPGRSGMILPIEPDDGGERWMVSLAGTKGGEPPADPAGFLAYTFDELPDPVIGELISHAEPLTDVVRTRGRMTRNVRRYFEQSAKWPEGLAVVGDALATFNPAYGQGMSVAAQQAVTLRDAFDRADVTTPGLARGIQRAVAEHVDGPWTTAVSQDVLYPFVTGAAPTVADRVAARYARRVAATATVSYPVARALWDVTGLRAGPARLMSPGTLLKVLLGPPAPLNTEIPLKPGERRTHRELRGVPQE
ncbi:pyridine nucleotide-disulfide oxidoreductase [Streptomyces sp900105245]|uniref:FAD-dependent oxidoreductase n=1 Tax=Streptomyces sp. 900105245 TaxID=3154379 RepID=UPI00331C1DED